MPRKQVRLHPITQIFFAMVAFTLVIWVLRGLAILAFMPGIIIWILMLCSISLGIVSSLQRIR